MTTTDIHPRQPQAADQPQPGRRIGVLGTTARLVVAAVLLGLVVATQTHRGLEPLSWILALVAAAVLLAGQWLRSLRFPGRIQATGPLGHTVNGGMIVALLGLGSAVPSLRAVSDGAIIFYATSMLLAAARGYAGCEALAISNWLLRRDDQIGCVFFLPIDRIDTARRASG